MERKFSIRSKFDGTRKAIQLFIFCQPQQSFVRNELVPSVILSRNNSSITAKHFDREHSNTWLTWRSFDFSLFNILLTLCPGTRFTVNTTPVIIMSIPCLFLHSQLIYFPQENVVVCSDSKDTMITYCSGIRTVLVRSTRISRQTRFSRFASQNVQWERPLGNNHDLWWGETKDNE